MIVLSSHSKSVSPMYQEESVTRTDGAGESVEFNIDSEMMINESEIHQATCSSSVL